MKLNQFAVYRVDQQTAGKALWHLPYQEARQQNVSITVENYRVISIHEMQEEEKVADIWKRMKKQCEVSDVLVLNRDGEINCYYVDENYPQYLAGFIRINTSGALITMETENYQIDGKKGNWIATDTIIINGKQFYLMEHQVYRDQAQGVILDAYGKMVVEECKKFDEKTKQKIHNYIQQQAPLNSVEQLKQDGKIRLEHYQKFYQNGTYERSRESGTEANYDMVDGLVNNQKKNPEKISNARSNKQTPRNQQDGKVDMERQELQMLISDISHQVKTPVSNLQMVTDTLLTKPVSEEERMDFLQGIRSQTDKLDFLFQALVKTSRLETGAIRLEKKDSSLFHTLAQAMSSIVYAAEKKEIAVSVDCPENLIISHDSKWTSEALFNLLDNAVKYTPSGGKISVSVVQWEMYVEVKVTDTGKGISESNQAAIFRRFYREEEVHDQQGVGIGLYLAREIVTRQGGYIKVVSELGQGSEFSIMLPVR